MNEFLIKNGFTVDFEKMKVHKNDVWVSEGKVKEISEHINPDGKMIIDADGKYVLPGLIDEHTHLNYKANAMGANVFQVALQLHLMQELQDGQILICSMLKIFNDLRPM